MICLDTMVLIWGVQGAARSRQEQMVERTRRFLRNLRSGNETLMVPTPALAEYLQGFQEADRRVQLTQLEELFYLPAFDSASAYLAAELSRRERVREAYRSGDRQAVKTDVQIVATAIVHGAKRIITHDVGDFERVAGQRILVSNVPNVAEQLDLPNSDSQPE